MGGYGKDRYGQAYYGVEGYDLAMSTLAISAELQAILSGADPKPIECAADVTIGGVAVPYIKDIKIERALSDRMGKAQLTILCDADNLPVNIIQNAEIIISSKITFGSGTFTRQIFAGRVDTFTAPNKGQIEGQIACFDGAKRLDDADVSGSMIGDVANWLRDRCSTLDMGTGFAVIEEGEPIEIVSSYNLVGYRNVMDAAIALASAYDQRYVFFTGAGEMVIFDPTATAIATPQITFARAIAFREMLDTSKRFNRISFSNYVGYAYDFVTYALTVTPEGVNTITAANVGTNTIISGVYEDLADQATYGVLDLSGGVQNNICSTEAQLEAYAESVSIESKRRRFSFSNRFNSLLELGTTHTFNGAAYFIGRIRHNISTQNLWTTDVEFWSVA